MGYSFLVIDIETTGLDPQLDDILEIGIVRVEIPNETIIPIFFQTIKPRQIPVTCWAFENSTLSREEIKDSMPLDTYRKQLQELFIKYDCVSYNTEFDFSFLKKNGFRLKYIMPDPMLFAQDILKLPSKKGGYKWPKVQECLYYFDILETEPHRALEDALLEAEIMLRLIDLGYFSSFFSKKQHHVKRHPKQK